MAPLTISALQTKLLHLYNHLKHKAVRNPTMVLMKRCERWSIGRRSLSHRPCQVLKICYFNPGRDKNQNFHYAEHVYLKLMIWFTEETAGKSVISQFVQSAKILY